MGVNPKLAALLRNYEVEIAHCVAARKEVYAVCECRSSSSPMRCATCEERAVTRCSHCSRLFCPQCHEREGEQHLEECGRNVIDTILSPFRRPKKDQVSGGEFFEFGDTVARYTRSLGPFVECKVTLDELRSAFRVRFQQLKNEEAARAYFAALSRAYAELRTLSQLQFGARVIEYVERARKFATFERTTLATATANEVLERAAALSERVTKRDVDAGVAATLLGTLEQVTRLRVSREPDPETLYRIMKGDDAEFAGMRELMEKVGRVLSDLALSVGSCEVRGEFDARDLALSASLLAHVREERDHRALVESMRALTSHEERARVRAFAAALSTHLEEASV